MVWIVDEVKSVRLLGADHIVPEPCERPRISEQRSECVDVGPFERIDAARYEGVLGGVHWRWQVIRIG